MAGSRRIIERAVRWSRRPEAAFRDFLFRERIRGTIVFPALVALGRFRDIVQLLRPSHQRQIDRSTDPVGDLLLRKSSRRIGVLGKRFPTDLLHQVEYGSYLIMIPSCWVHRWPLQY